MAQPDHPAWRYLNAPIIIWALSALTAVLFVSYWRPYELQLQRSADAAIEHEKLHVEVKSRLEGLRDEVRDHVSQPEIRRSLDTGSSANVHREMETRSLRSLALEHDDMVARDKVHCGISFTKGTQSIYQALRNGAPESLSAAKTGVESLLQQLGGNAN